MPYKDGKLWAGQVRKKFMKEEYTPLLGMTGWTRLKNGSIQYKRIKRKIKTKTAAAKWERDHWKEVQTKLIAPLFQIRTTFSGASGDYLNSVQKRSTSETNNTYNYKNKLIADVVEFWQEDKPLPIETLDVESFLDHVFDTQGGKKANRSRRELNTLFRWMRKRHIVEVNPVSPIEEYMQEDFVKYVPPKEDIRAVIQVASAQDKDILRVAYHTLARSGELRRLKKVDCDFINKKVTLYTRKTKGGKLEPGKIDMNATLEEILRRRCKTVEGPYIFHSLEHGGKMTKFVIGRILPRMCARVNKLRKEVGQEGIKPFTLHGIRHHVAAHLFLNCQYSVAELQKILRHKRASTTDRYLRSIIDMDTTRGLSALDEDNYNTETVNQEGKIIGYPGRPSGRPLHSQ